MRIITGFARGAKLAAPPGDHTRPTSEKVKEAIFSAIHFDLYDQKVLDLFGGSGQMALEALSRGARKATIVDNDRKALEVIKANAAKTGLMEKCVVVNSGWKEFVGRSKDKFSLFFLDPPYKEGLLDEVIAKIRESGIMTEKAIFVCESGEAEQPAPPEDALFRVYRYGAVYISIFRF